MTALGLYIHVPFCQSICNYCNFNRGLFDRSLADRYLAAVEVEIAGAADGTPVDTIFFGGGTPSLLDPQAIDRLIAACRRGYDVAPDAEVTIEVNPESATAERAERWLASGVTRLSLGAQSFDDDELRRLDRAHQAAQINHAVSVVRQAGAPNISLDLMCWLPGQTAASWQRSLDAVVRLEPEHVSVYLLELYPNAPLKEAMARGRAGDTTAPDWTQAADDAAADMYLQAFEHLEEAGWPQYEISNAARPGRSCRHNLKYWRGESWRGFGPGAHSTVDRRRWQNVASTAEYVARIEGGRDVHLGREDLTEATVAADALMTGLRLTSGVDRVAFARRFGFDPFDRHADVLGEAIQEGLVWVSGQSFGLSRRGMLVSNEIVQWLI